MDGQPQLNAAAAKALVATGIVPCDQRYVARDLSRQMGDGPFALVSLFASPAADFPHLMAQAQQVWSDAAIIGATTAGEIAPNAGYVDDSVVAIGFPTRHFRAELVPFRNLTEAVERDTIGDVVRARTQLGRHSKGFDHEFALLLINGLSMAEDWLAASIAGGLGPMPMFGGSSGDGIRFDHAPVAYGGEILEDGAVLAMLRTDCPVQVFSLNNFRPTDRRVVVTGADPSRRIVHEINAEPAALELGRLLGKAQIDTFTFAQNPMIVRLGDRHHVRAIKRVTEDGALEFFSAIDEGLVLTIGEGSDIVGHLRDEMEQISRPTKPDTVIAFDCLLRRIEAEQRQLSRDVSEVLREYRAVGFSTYGEQIGGMHVNQTMTGVALFAPETATTDAP